MTQPSLRKKCLKKDNAITPEWIMNKIYKCLKIWNLDFTDIFIFKPKWRAGYNYDAWTAELPERPLYSNHPFS